jgi:hypothetical protein
MAESGFVVVDENVGTDAARGHGVVEGASGLLEAAVAALPLRAVNIEGDAPRRRRVVRPSRRAAQLTAVEVPVRSSHRVRRAVVALTLLTALVGAFVILRRRRSKTSETETMLQNEVIPDGEVAATMGETASLE